MVKPELHDIDDDAVANLTRLNPALGTMLGKIYASRDGDTGYFVQDPGFDMKADLKKYVKVGNLHSETRRLCVLIRVTDGAGVGNVFIALREAVELRRHFSIDLLYFQFSDISPSNESYRSFFDFKDTFVNVVEGDGLDLPEDAGVVMFDGLFLVMYGLYKKGRIHKETMDFLTQTYVPMDCGAPYPMDTLVIHVRSGDIFKPGAVFHNETYQLQPPLVWYQKCIAAHRRHYPGTSVLMVAADNANPCVDAVTAWCRDVGIETTMQMGTVMEDCLCLMRAQAIVDSRGTFTEMVRKISRNLKMMYRLERRYYAGGPYDITGSWHYTPEVKQRLLDAREEDLFLPPDVYEDAFCLDRYRKFL